MASQSVPRKVVHYTEVLDPHPDDPCHREWMTWKEEMPRLLREGYEGKFILIKGDRIHGPYDSDEDAREVAHSVFPLQGVLIRQVLEYEPVLNVPAMYPGSSPCPTSR